MSELGPAFPDWTEVLRARAAWNNRALTGGTREDLERLRHEYEDERAFYFAGVSERRALAADNAARASEALAITNTALARRQFYTNVILAVLVGGQLVVG